MARNRHKKNLSNISFPSLPKPIGKPSPTAQIVANRIASGGPEYLMDNLIHIMTGSAKLAQEPDFIDVSLNGNKAAEVTQHWLQKYEKRLAAAEKKDPDEYQQVFDEMRIKIIDELATPAFRKDIDQRLQTTLDRLMIKGDPDTLEMVLMLKLMLGLKEIPWGLCGLILEIYNRTMSQAMAAYEKDREILDALTEALKEEGEEAIDISKIMESPEKLERVGQKLFGENPRLRESAEKQAWDMANVFEKELAKGKVALDLFTEEELLLPFQRLQEEYGQPVTEKQPTDELRKRSFDAIVQAIQDILTPERFHRFRNDVKSTAKVWMRERQKWAAALQFELGSLEGEVYEENKFVLSAFIGQLYRAGEEQKSTPKPKSEDIE
jgi:hypothetical protein